MAELLLDGEPVRKARPVAFKMEAVESVVDVGKAQVAILAAMARGELSPDEAADASQMVAAARQSVAMQEIETRLAAIEEELSVPGPMITGREKDFRQRLRKVEVATADRRKRDNAIREQMRKAAEGFEKAIARDRAAELSPDKKERGQRLAPPPPTQPEFYNPTPKSDED
jgi:hypothetical protein